MKTLIEKHIYIFVLFAPLAYMVALSGCSVKDGMDGSRGPQGEQGPKGDDGNANVITATVDLLDTDWIWPGNYFFSTQPGGATNFLTREAELSVPKLDADINDNGVVLVFMKLHPSTGWQALPVIIPSFDYTFNNHFVYEHEVGQILLHYFQSNNQGDTETEWWNNTLPEYSAKYVLIQGTTANKSSDLSKADYRKMTYEQLVAHFGLDH